MTRAETSVIMNILTAAYPRFYSGPEAPDVKQSLALWAEMFAEDDVALVAAAVKRYIATDLKGYPPHIGAVKNALYELARPEGLDADRAWELLRRAASRSAYGAREEFERLPEELRRAVGSPSQLYEWSQMDSEVFNSVIGSNFRRSWVARQESRRRDALLPGNVKRLIGTLAKPAALAPPEDAQDEKKRA